MARKAINKRLDKYRKGSGARHRLAWQSGDPESLLAAAKALDLNPKDDHDRETLLRILAEAIFGNHLGRPKGKPAWGENRLLMLGFAYRDKKYKNPKLSDAKIAKLICKEKDFKHDDPEQIRQRLGLARQEYDKWHDSEMDEAAADMALEAEDQYEIMDDDY